MNMTHQHEYESATPDGASPEGRRLLLEYGYEVLPICGKAPLWPKWRSEPVTAALLDRIETQHPDHTNTGVRTGNLAVADIDLWNPDHASAIKDTIFAVLGHNNVERVGAKGYALCYYNPTPIPKITVTGIPEGENGPVTLFEILGLGQQVAAYGIHPGTSKPYDWPNAFLGDDLLGTPLTKLPAVSPDKLREAARAVQTALTGLGYREVAVHGLEEHQRESSSRNGDPVPLEQLIAMLSVIPPDLPRKDWLHVVWGVKDANTVPHMDDDERIGLLDRFSSGELGGVESPGNYEGYEDVERTYCSGKGSADPVTVGTIYRIARKNGFQGGPPRVDLTAMAFANDNFRASIMLSSVDEPHESRWPKLTFRGDEIFNMPPATALIPGWLRDMGVTFLLAQRGTGKTVLAVDVALSMATDRDWMGEPVTQGLHAVFVAGEDVENTAQHVMAWCKYHNGGKVPDRFALIGDVPDLMDPEDCPALAKHLRTFVPEGKRAVVFVDTWQRATSMAPDGQNSDRDMGIAVKRVEALARQLGGPVVCCCHPPKDARVTATVMGSSVIENASTGIWHLTKENAGLKLEVNRIKGAGLGNYKHLDHKMVMLDRCDERGQRLTGLVATYVGGNRSHVLDAREAERAARQAVLNTVLDLFNRGIMVMKTGGGGRKPRDVAVAVKKQYGHDLTARQVSDHLVALEDEGLLKYVWADKNHKDIKAGFRPSSGSIVPAESSAESPPKAIPNSAESD
jgi:hypothetical protein